MRKAAWGCLSFSGAIFVSVYLLPSGGFPWAVVVCALYSLLGFLFRGKTRLCIWLVTLGALAGFLVFWIQSCTVIAPAEVLADSEQVITARAAEFPQVYDDSTYLTVRLTGKDMPRVKCRLVSYGGEELKSFEPGDELRVEAKLLSAGVRNGQEIDSYYAKGIFLRATCRGEPERIGRWRGAFLYAPVRLAHQLAKTCEEIFPPDASPFMTALLLGEKTALYADGDHYYRIGAAGLSHVVAVSGMHISFLMGFFFLVFGRNRRGVLLSLPVLLGFAAMTGFSPSVVRAVFMQLCLLTAPLLRRDSDIPTSLSAALALLLLVNPSAAASVSLQLSFAAMGGICLVSQRIYTSMTRRFDASRAGNSRLMRRIVYPLIGNVASSVGALLLSVPLAAVHFGYVSVLSPLSNILCLWMISILYIGGFLLLILAAFLPGIAAGIGALLAWGVRYIFFVAGLIEKVPFACVYLTNPVYILWLVFVYVIFFAAWICARKSGQLRIVMPLCVSVLSLLFCVGGTQLLRADELHLAALDVGQGECVALTAGDYAAVVDCGASWVTHDAAEAASHYLRGRQYRHLDALILTHLHSDHVNGAADLLYRMRVRDLYMPCETDDGDGHLSEILAAAEAEGTNVHYVNQNILLKLGDMELTLFAPLLPGKENENGLIVLAKQGDFEALIMGDAPGEAEILLTKQYALPDTEVLVVSHHGSATSTVSALLEEAMPDLAVISVGYNTYGHPTQKVLDRLAYYNIPVLRTDREGRITVTSGKR